MRKLIRKCLNPPLNYGIDIISIYIPIRLITPLNLRGGLSYIVLFDKNSI